MVQFGFGFGFGILWNLLKVESIFFPRDISVSETLFLDPDILLRKGPLRMTSG